MKQFAGHSIARHYRSVTIHFFSRLTKGRTSTLKVTPKKGLSHRKRYDVIADALTKCELIGYAPCYDPKR